MKKEININRLSTNKPGPKIFGLGVYLGTYASSLFIQGCTVLQGILLARLLGPEGRGEFAAIILWPNIFAGLGGLGINMALARQAGKTQDIGSLVKSSVVLSCCTGFIAALCCYFCLPYLVPPEMGRVLPLSIVFLISIPLSHLAWNLLGIDQGAGNFKVFNLTRAVLYPVFLTGLVAAWLAADDKLLWVVVSLLVGNGCLVLLRLGVRWYDFFGMSTFVPLIQLIKEGFLYHVSNIFIILSQHVDQVILLWFLSPDNLGLYTVARSVGTVVYSLPASFEIISFSQAVTLDKNSGFKPLAVIVRRGFLMSMLLAILLAPLLPVLIPLVYGADFSKAVSLSLIIMIGSVIAGLASIVEQALRGHGMPLSGISTRLLGIVVMGSSGLVTLQLHGAVGVAFSWSLSQCFMLVAFLKKSVDYFGDNAAFREFVPQVEDIHFLIRRTLAVLAQIGKPR